MNKADKSMIPYNILLISLIFICPNCILVADDIFDISYDLMLYIIAIWFVSLISTYLMISVDINIYHVII